MRNFKKYLVWQKSMILVKEVYHLVRKLPNQEKYGLVNQITRAAISIPSNIAEGCGRASEKEMKRYIEISLGSSYELETQLLVIKDVFHVDNHEIIALTTEVQKMLQSLIKKLTVNS